MLVVATPLARNLVLEAAWGCPLGRCTSASPPTKDLAKEIANLAPLVHKWHKQILHTVLANPSLQNLTPAEEVLPYDCFDTQDFQEGYQAFLEKRQPKFAGR